MLWHNRLHCRVGPRDVERAPDKIAISPAQPITRSARRWRPDEVITLQRGSATSRRPWHPGLAAKGKSRDGYRRDIDYCKSIV